MAQASRWLKGIAIAAAGIIVVVGVVPILVAAFAPSRVDEDDSTYRYISERVREKSRPLAREGPEYSKHAEYFEATVDLASVNRGDWQFMCLLGGPADPEEELRAEADRRNVALGKVQSFRSGGSALASIDRYESAIAFVDSSGSGRIVLFENPRVAADSFVRCFGREVREVVLPIT